MIRCKPKLDSNLAVMINKLDRVLYECPFPRLLKRTRETKQLCLELSERYRYFTPYTPNDLHNDVFMDRWIRRAIAGRGMRFYYTDGLTKYYAMWLQGEADAAKFNNLIGRDTPLRR